MAIEFDAASITSFSTNTDPWTLSHTVGDGPARIIFAAFAFSWPAENEVYSVSFAGQAMTKIGEVNYGATFGDVQLWYLLNPPVGTNSVSVNFAMGDHGNLGLASYFGVNQSDPIQDYDSKYDGNLQDSISLGVTSRVGGLVVDAVGTWHTSSITLTPGSGQTARFRGQNKFPMVGFSEKAGAPSVTMSWTSSVNRSGGLIVASLNPSLGGSQAIWFWFERARRFYDDLRNGLIPLGDLEQRYQEVMI